MSNIVDTLDGTGINLYEVHIANGFYNYGVQVMSLSLEKAKDWVLNEFLPTRKWSKYDYIVVFGENREVKWQYDGIVWTQKV